MKKNVFKIISYTSIILSILFFTGCPVSINVTALENNQLSYNFSTTAGKATNELISSFDNTFADVSSAIILPSHKTMHLCPYSSIKCIS